MYVWRRLVDTGLGTFDIAKITTLLQPVAAALPPAPALGGSPCTPPGDLLAVGVPGSQNDGLATHNALDIHVAEPLPATTHGADSFVFTLQVDSFDNSVSQASSTKQPVDDTPQGICTPVGNTACVSRGRLPRGVSICRLD